MKLGLHLFLWFDQLDNIPHLIDKAKLFGCEILEIPLQQITSQSITTIRNKLRRLNMGCVGCVILPMEADITSSDERVRQNGIELLKGCVDIVVELERAPDSAGRV